MLRMDPSSRALSATNPSPTELQRLQDKLAFYEQPITTFDRPVENDPIELVDAAHGQRVDTTACGAKQRKHNARGEDETCLLVRFARRAVAAVRKLLSTRRAHAMHKETRSKTLKTLHGRGHKHCATRAGGRARFQELDESTRFRLELAGIRVQRAPPPYTVRV